MRCYTLQYIPTLRADTLARVLHTVTHYVRVEHRKKCSNNGSYNNKINAKHVLFPRRRI